MEVLEKRWFGRRDAERRVQRRAAQLGLIALALAACRSPQAQIGLEPRNEASDTARVDARSAVELPDRKVVQPSADVVEQTPSTPASPNPASPNHVASDDDDVGRGDRNDVTAQVGESIVGEPNVSDATGTARLDNELVTPSGNAAVEAASTAVTPTPTAAEAAIQDVVSRYYDAWSLAEWDQFSAQFWGDAQLASVRPRTPGAADDVVSVGIAEYTAEARRTVVRTQPLQVVRETRRIDVFSDVAQVVIEYRATDHGGDAPQNWRGIDCFTLVRHSGEWRVAALVFAPTPTATTPTPTTP